MEPPQIKKSTQAHIKKTYRIDKTASMTETFPGRLKWKKKHFGKPVTSTPVVVKRKEEYRKDAENCFGFDDSEDEDYSTLISPIYKEKKSRPQKVVAVPLNEEAAAVFAVPPSPLKEVKGNENEETIPNIQIALKFSQPLSKIPDSQSSQNSVRLYQELKKPVRKKNGKPVDSKKKIISEENKIEENQPIPVQVEEETPKLTKKIKKLPSKKVEETKKSKKVKDRSKTSSVRRTSRRLQEMFFKTGSNAQKPTHESRTEFKDLLKKYKEEDSDQDEDSFIIDPYKIINTYPSRKRTTTGAKKMSKKRKSKGKVVEKTIVIEDEPIKKIVKSRKKLKVEEPSPEEEEWIEKIKNEFKRVESVPLLVQNDVTNTTIYLE